MIDLLLYTFGKLSHGYNGQHYNISTRFSERRRDKKRTGCIEFSVGFYELILKIFTTSKSVRWRTSSVILKFAEQNLHKDSIFSWCRFFLGLCHGPLKLYEFSSELYWSWSELFMVLRTLDGPCFFFFFFQFLS